MRELSNHELVSVLGGASLGAKSTTAHHKMRLVQPTGLLYYERHDPRLTLSLPVTV